MKIDFNETVKQGDRELCPDCMSEGHESEVETVTQANGPDDFDVVAVHCKTCGWGIEL